MTENELFEQWFDDFHIEEHFNYKTIKDFAFASWQARAELADKEKADLKASNDYLKELSYVKSEHISELQVYINDLRDALEVCKYDCHTGEVIGVAQQALSKTPAQSLQKHEAKEKWEANLISQVTDPNQ